MGLNESTLGRSPLGAGDRRHFGHPFPERFTGTSRRRGLMLEAARMGVMNNSTPPTVLRPEQSREGAPQSLFHSSQVTSRRRARSPSRRALGSQGAARKSRKPSPAGPRALWVTPRSWAEMFSPDHDGLIRARRRARAINDAGVDDRDYRVSRGLSADRSACAAGNDRKSRAHDERRGPKLRRFHVLPSIPPPPEAGYTARTLRAGQACIRCER
jgi:hypothetical protein